MQTSDQKVCEIVLSTILEAACFDIAQHICAEETNPNMLKYMVASCLQQSW